MAGVYGTGIVSVQEAAASLALQTAGASIEDVAVYLSRLGGIGPGLHELMAAHQNVAGIFHVIFNLSMLSEMVQANKCNCRRLCVLGHDVLALLDNAGRRGATVRTIGLEALTACFEDISTLVDAFTQHGWLLRLTGDAKLREEFETLHQAVLELLKGEGLLSLAGAKTPVHVEYRDFCRPLKRLLKQMGSGSLSAGLQQLRVNDKSCVEVARLLDVQFETVKEEVATLPQTDLELDVLYHQLLQPTSSLTGGISSSGTPGRLSDAAHSRAGSRTGALAAAGDQADAALGRRSSSSFGLSMNGQAATSLYGDLFRWYDRNKSGALELEELQAALQDLGMLDGKRPDEIRTMVKQHMRMADAAAAARGDGVGFDAFCRFYETVVMAKARQQLRFKLGLQVEEDLRTTFLSFAGFGSREHVADMSGAHFQKLCRDCGLVDRATDITEVDLVFCYVKTKGARRITFEQFLTALSKLAERKGVAFEDVVLKVLTAGGPINKASIQPEYVRLHDDKSTFTGVYARGGPVQQGVGEGLDLSFMVNRLIPESAKRGAGSPSSPGSVAATHPSRRTNKSVGGLHGTSHSHSNARTPSPCNSNSLSRASSLDRYNSSTPFAALALPSPTHNSSTAMRSPRAEAMLNSRRVSGSGPHDRRASGGPGPHDRRASGSGPPDGSGVSFSLFHRRVSGAAAGAAAAASTRAFSSTPASVGGAGRAVSGTAGGTAGGTPSPAVVMCTALGSRAASANLAQSIVDNCGQQVGASASVDADSPAAAAAAAAAGAVCLGRISPAAAGSSLTPNPSSSNSSRWCSLGLLEQAGAAGAAAAARAAAAVASSRRASRDSPADSSSSSCTPLERLSKGGAVQGRPASPGEGQLREVFAAFAGFGIRSPAVPPQAQRGAFRSSAGGGSGGNLQQQQQQYSQGGSPVVKPLVLEMDGFRFVKLCRETQLFDDKFTTTGADIIFAKVKSKGAKKITYVQFMTALSLIACVKKVSPHSVLDMVLQGGGPAINSSLMSSPASLATDLARVHDAVR